MVLTVVVFLYATKCAKGTSNQTPNVLIMSQFQTYLD